MGSHRGIERIRLARNLAFLLSAALFAAAAIAATQEQAPTIAFAWGDEGSAHAAAGDGFVADAQGVDR